LTFLKPYWGLIRLSEKEKTPKKEKLNQSNIIIGSKLVKKAQISSNKGLRAYRARG
tara:strand:- start:431 stop:598 length:168 start_codon:yes stop_codon:yes gene_type:complete